MKNLIDCPAERAVYFLGGKWKIRILFSLLHNKKIRFGELKKGLKTITQQMLSKQLKELEGDGIINRKVIRIMPPKVEYSLTEFGLSVMPILRSFSEWNKRNTRTISVKLNKNFEENRIR
ncbi:winged helix-turn-helix transcriptional regulator [Candidatus Pelagibacter sp.]|jgi:DNA-binding HxlR family transcriptional regulator|nr:winged helix-turn-helix transcriptional regulator [Candidatus Pelagibacter sp.]MDB2470856.1 winged helix-turn-helix transcriptional regulator [Candidatus Pelagibacter bacterium]MDC1337920.1 winged helix-turn-helix transcriptional regulator [Pelagibacteraceae bacterium]MDA7801753.1 winged helix-turn-helix transcriptional regulator [Candidatus Pelagibacter sp.]MDA9637856.1 winged helix-turn-helix transcriptional regulator [Candidatus Pelagibacter sp.]